MAEENKTPEEVAQELEKQFEEKFKGVASQEEMQTLKDSFEKIKEDAAKAVENEKALEEVKAKNEELQKHLDEIDMSGKGGYGREEKSELQNQIEDYTDQLAKAANTQGFDPGVSFSLTPKAFNRIKANMYTSNNTTGDVIEPDRLQGVFSDPVRSQHVRDVMNVVSTTSDTIYFVQETAYTDGAGTTKDENEAGNTDLSFTQKEAPVRNIDTYVTVHRNMLNDAPFLQSYIETRVPNKLMLVEDNQVLYGNGNAPNLNGITNQAQAYTDNLADSNVNRYDVLFNAVTNARVDEYVPNVAYVHPNDFQKMVLTKDSNGMYVFPQALNGQGVVVNGARVIPSTAINDGDFLVGDFRMGATFAQRENLQIDITNSHDKNFTKGFVTMLIHERVAMPVHNPNAFVYSDFATELATGSA